MRTFLLVENAGPWGVDAWRDSRLPEGVGPALKQLATAARVRPLLVRPGGRVGSDDRIRVYAAHADQDPSAPPEQIERLEAALRDAGVTFTSELYEGAHHGWTMSDMQVYDAAGEQRHWDNLLGLLERRQPVQAG